MFARAENIYVYIYECGKTETKDKIMNEKELKKNCHISKI